MAREKSPYAGMQVKTKDGKTFTVEDWWQNVYGVSWMHSDGNPAAMQYGIRVATEGLPIDDEVLYGKVGAFGFLYHVTELALPGVS